MKEKQNTYMNHLHRLFLTQSDKKYQKAKTLRIQTTEY